MTATVERPKDTSTVAASGAHEEPGVYARLGVPTFINASGHNTAQGGSLMPPEVLAAMNEAARRHVWLRALQDAAGKRIAEVAGAPAALVGSGAAGCILLGAAACLTGKDPARIIALPETAADAQNEIVVWAAQRPNYMYQACQAAGAALVEVGEIGGPVTPEDFGDALDRHSAGILLVLAPLDQHLSTLTGDDAMGWEEFIGEVCDYADAAGVPVLVDAASELPPRGLIPQLLELGVSGVIVSGGKAIRGPQSTGLLLGKPELIQAAALNNNPNSAVGRPLKVGKEEICGAVAAVERFFAMDEAAQLADFRERSQTIADAANRAGGTKVRAEVIERDPNYGRPPLVAKAVLRFDGGANAADALYQRLHDGEGGGPRINALRQGDVLIFNPMPLEPGEAEVIAARLTALLH
jgi:L-seryl-tRNA(Ser) seleniumtransferase